MISRVGLSFAVLFLTCASVAQSEVDYRHDEFTGDFRITSDSMQTDGATGEIDVDVRCIGNISSRSRVSCGLHFVARARARSEERPYDVSKPVSVVLRLLLDGERAAPIETSSFESGTRGTPLLFSFPMSIDMIHRMIESDTTRARIDFKYSERPRSPFSISSRRVWMNPEFLFPSAMKNSMREVLRRIPNTNDSLSAQQGQGMPSNRKSADTMATVSGIPIPSNANVFSYDDLVTIIERQFPSLNPDMPAYSDYEVGVVLRQRDQFRDAGLSVNEALIHAVQSHFGRPVGL